MNISLKTIIRNNSSCITNSEKLKEAISNAYPNINRGILNAIITLQQCGLLKELINGQQLDIDTINKWENILKNEYGFSNSIIKSALDTYIVFQSKEWENPILNAQVSLSQQSLFKWIKHEIIADIEDIIDNSCVDDDSEEPQLNFEDDSTLSQDAIHPTALKRYNVSVSEYLTNCAHSLKLFPQYMRGIYFCVAKVLYYNYHFNSKFDELEQELSAICEIANIADTKNIDLVIEQLLILSYKHGNESAFIALENSYMQNIRTDFETDMVWFNVENLNLNDERYETLDINNIGTKKDNDLNARIVRKTWYTLFYNKQKLTNSVIGTIIEFYYYAIPILGKELYDIDMPFLELKAAEKISPIAEIIFNYFEQYDTRNYYGKLKDFAKKGDYNAQGRLALYYKQAYISKNEPRYFDSAVKYFELATNNSQRMGDIKYLQEYSDFLIRNKPVACCDRIAELNEEIARNNGDWYIEMQIDGKPYKFKV